MILGDDQLAQVRHDLVVKWMGLAQGIAMRFWKKAPSVIDREEVLSVAYQGLVVAADRFDFDFRPPDDPQYDPLLAFPAYARTRITGTVQDWMRKMDHVPRRQRQTYRDIQQHAPGRTPEETAEILGLDVGRVRAVTRAVLNPPISLNEMQDTRSVEDTTPAAEGSAEGAAFTRMVQDAVGAIYLEMDPLQKSVLALRYYSGFDFPRIAATLGVPTSTVKVVHQEAVVLVHAAMLDTATS